ncbi:hypothetical protein RN001_002604 [Aquatica leii]|uniref:Uncharacterized protein n=1 Tax=Aquatica leii TaxID=1421715 RepID=A0AAN7SRA6_9COLE|nr:hypothetical protein RN001_002604 [Aquatica leii]
MTGDPNERNKPTMFGFGCSYLSTSVDFPRFNNQPANVNPLFPSHTELTPISPFFSISTSQTPFTSTGNNLVNYSLPSSSTTINNGFPFSQQIPVSIDCSRNIAETFSHQGPNVFFGNQFSNIPNDTKITFGSQSIKSRHYGSQPISGTFGCKRKTESPSTVPMKQHITEERMAEHMSRLHISSQTPSSTLESLPTRERRLYMCEEMQRLQAESIIPAQILEKVYRPCTALVPWRPPIVPALAKENNNNEEEPDNNRMDNMDMDS